MRQSPHVLYHVMLRSEHRPEPVARVVGPQLHRHGSFQHRADALMQKPGCGRLRNNVNP